MDKTQKEQFQKIAGAIRHLSMDATEKADSGHPGLPLGCAEIGAFLYGNCLNHYPKNPEWINRDRFVLSAGHGSMLLYSCLHLSGFALSLEDIKNFRQLHSKTPGHPELGVTEGVEVTSGPLGQGFGNAVGMALGMKILAQKFNTQEFSLIDSKVYCLASDGDIMEGVSSEASSFAGHLRLNNLIVIYDANNISLDGPLSDCFSEDVKGRYRSYGWDVYEIDGHDLDAIEAIMGEINQNQQKPALVVAHTIIGKGSPLKQGSHKSHGSPLGKEEVTAAKKALYLSQEDFYVPQSVRDFFDARLEKQKKSYHSWQEKFQRWAKARPDLYEMYEKMLQKSFPEDLEKFLNDIVISTPISGREASHKIANSLAPVIPSLYSGSADLSTSDKTSLDKYPFLTFSDFSGRNIKFGVREFAMGTIASGLARVGTFLPFIGTFLAFSDYMRSAIRLAALSKFQIIYQFTHDSFFLGEDGPTHQPVEHLASFRAMPNLQVIRPSGVHEVKMAWVAALQYKGPTAIILSRQKVKEVPGTDVCFSEGMQRGAYIVKKEKNVPDFTLFASGSELPLAFEVAACLEKLSKDVRIVSFPCFSLFDKQPKEYQKSILDGNLGVKVSIEAASDFGWHKYIGREGICISLESFGLSAPMNQLAREFGFTADMILERILF